MQSATTTNNAIDPCIPAVPALARACTAPTPLPTPTPIPTPSNSNFNPGRRRLGREEYQRQQPDLGQGETSTSTSTRTSTSLRTRAGTKTKTTKNKHTAPASTKMATLARTVARSQARMLAETGVVFRQGSETKPQQGAGKRNVGVTVCSAFVDVLVCLHLQALISVVVHGFLST